MKNLITFAATIAVAAAIDVEFHDLFGGIRNISIPSCKAEPCRIVQGRPLITFITFAAESPYYRHDKTFETYTTGQLTTLMHGYGNAFATGLTNKSDLSVYGVSFPLEPKQISKARVPLVARRIDPKEGPYKSTGRKFMSYMINIGNETDSITVASATIALYVIH